MRILKPGRVTDAPEVTRPHRGRCHRCCAEVEVFGDEVRRMKRPTWLGHYWCVGCPTPHCGEVICVIPVEVKSYADR